MALIDAFILWCLVLEYDSLSDASLIGYQLVFVQLIEHLSYFHLALKSKCS
jgi:hypothetical protein